MRRALAAIVTLIAALTIYPASAQTAAEVLKSFRKLQADTEAGLNFKEYARGMAEVNAQLRNFGDNNQGKPTPETIKALTVAFEQYVKARALWDESQVRDLKYQHQELSIDEYFGRKRAIFEEIAALWGVAGAETDRAAKMLKR